MRLWKKISIFVIYPILMLAVGFLASVKLHDFFYPSQNSRQEQPIAQDVASGEDDGSDGTSVSGAAADIQESMQALGTGGAVITCDTRFVIKSLDLTDSSREEEESPVPEQYIGMDRQEFLSAMNSYASSPSLNDLNKGFLSLDVQKFSAQEVVIQKNYESKKKCTEFYLAVENNYVVVYEVDKKTKYMSTGIPIQSLSDKLAREILQFKYVGSEAELYNFLESYSS